MAGPTQDAYAELDQAYTHFNAELFDGKLPQCLFTYQRMKNVYGYFSSKRFVNQKDGSYIDELAINPAYFAVVPLMEIMQTMVHEQAHLWQDHFGDPGRRRYHNKQWAEKMIAIGLMPSHTGKPGGKQTGEKMADYAIKGGRFMEAYDKLLATSFQITWYDRYPARFVHTSLLQEAMSGSVEGVDLGSALGLAEGTPLTLDMPEFMPSKPTRAKYSCTCKTNVWGKPGIKLICGTCYDHFVEVD